MPAGGYYVATIHRPDNTDDPERLRGIVDALAGLDRPVLLLAHPRLLSLAARFGLQLEHGALRILAPLPYPELVAAVMHSAGVVTDSGGLQKEAFLLRVPATTIRPETEWVETLDLGWNVLANDVDAIAGAVSRPKPEPTDSAPYGDGHAAEAVVSELLSR
jgi:UDP-N-acetylglucosamine 2-epimerase (non-hydrolysing)